MTNSTNLKPHHVLFIRKKFKNSSYSEIMVKYTITLEDGTENTKFSREFNTNGVGEELLHPVEVNDSLIGQPQPETNLATYLIDFQEFQKSNVEIKRNGNKVWLFYTSKYNILHFRGRHRAARTGMGPLSPV